MAARVILLGELLDSLSGSGEEEIEITKGEYGSQDYEYGRY